MKTIFDIQDMIDELQESADKLESNYIDYVRSGCSSDKILANMEYQTLTFRWGQISMLEWVLDGMVEDELKDVGNKEDKQ